MKTTRNALLMGLIFTISSFAAAKPTKPPAPVEPTITTLDQASVDAITKNVVAGVKELLKGLGFPPPVVTPPPPPPVVDTPPPPPPVVDPPPPPAAVTNISAVWANEGGDKVAQSELRATNKVENKTGTVINRAWDGATIKLSGARNEVISFNLVLEAATTQAKGVSVTLDSLVGPNGATIMSSPRPNGEVYNWVGRQIELFYARYVQIKGLSFFGYFKGDERQIPTRLQASSHNWADRPDHDKMYPDALVPLEWVPSFDIAQGTNQSIFADLYLAKEMPAGVYTGAVKISEGGKVTKSIPVSLTLLGFSLPDVPSAKTFMNLDPKDIVNRYIAPDGHYINWNSDEGRKAVQITDKYYALFHRHKIDLVGDNDCPVADRPCDTSMPRLNGSLFTTDNNYDGPGANTGVGIYSIGTYGTWGAGSYGVPYWKTDQSLFYQHIDNWENWFRANLPNTEHFIYLADEPTSGTCSSEYCTSAAQVQNWAKWINTDPGPGKTLLSFSTYSAVAAIKDMPDVDIPASASGIGGCPTGVNSCDNTAVTQAAVNALLNNPDKRFWMYNENRPGTGALETESDGTDPRTIGWVAAKTGVQRWYHWFANVSCCGDFYTKSLTFGNYNRFDNSIGWTGDDGTSNGDGLVVYPGKDLVNPNSSYGVDGPVASLRMKNWRRGIQDADYIALARQVDTAAANAVVAAAVPKALWENPAPGGDVTWFSGPISWSSNPDDWEAKRDQLASLITFGCKKSPTLSFCQ